MKIAMRMIVVGIAGLSCWISAGARADDARGRPMRMLQDEHMALQPAVGAASADKFASRPLPEESSGFANADGGPAAAMLADVYRATRDGVAAEAVMDRGPGPRPMPPEVKPDKLKKPR
jgi:hypothetical protein